MKKLLKFNILYAGFILLAVCILSACSKNETKYDIAGDKTNKVYINTQTTYVNNFTVPIIHTPISEIGTIKATFPAQCTLEAASDLTVTFVQDNSLVDAYNKAKSTKYSKVPDGVVVISNNGVTIPKGSLASIDSVTISIPNDKFPQLTDSGYIIPVRISGLSSSSNSAISSNQNVVYVVITTSWTNCYNSPVIGDMTGTLITPRTSWSATLSVTPYSGTLPQLFDGSTSSYIRFQPPVSFSLAVNLGASFTGISGIRINSNSTSYGLTKVKVYSSDDGVTWVYQGIPTLSTSSAYQYIKFYSPISARYLRIDAVTWRSTSRIYMAEFDVYKN